jgi:hypothetical protein
MHLDAAVVFDEAQFPEFVHEKTHPRPGRADHFRKRLLADLQFNRLRLPFLAEIRQQKERPRQALLAGIEQLIDQVFSTRLLRISRWAVNISANVGSA